MRPNSCPSLDVPTRVGVRARGAVGVLALMLGFALAPAARAATYNVTSTGDTLGGSCLPSSCSLRQAVRAVNEGPGSDTINIPSGTYVLTAGELTVEKSVTIVGSGARATTITAAGANRDLKIAEHETTASGLTVTGGTAEFGAGILVGVGAGLTLTDSAVSANTATTGGELTGGGVYISSSATATLNRVTVSGNAARLGAGIYNDGALIATDSTIAGNTAIELGSSGDGGGFYNQGGGSTATFTNVTFAANSATGPFGAGGNMETNSFGVTLKNTIVTGGAAHESQNCSGSVTSSGHNIENLNTCGLAGPGDQPSTDPKIGALQNNGGPTETYALLPGSPAIDAATSSGAPATDQRGVARPQSAGFDIGAYEVAAPLANTAAATGVSATGTTLNGSVTANAASASYHFQYGTTTAYGGSTAGAENGPGVSPVPVSAAIAGLSPSTTYHYRLVVTNADGGTSIGADQTFTTAPLPPPTITSAHQSASTWREGGKLVEHQATFAVSTTARSFASSTL
jgi:CSLREA domain-containing protein